MKYTGLFIDQESWDSVKQQVEGKSADVSDINNRIPKIYSKVLDAYYRLETINNDFSVYYLK